MIHKETYQNINTSKFCTTAVALFVVLSAISLFSTSVQATEYYVRADGAVSVISGAVALHYNHPGDNSSVKADVPAGYSFDPATGEVVPTTAAYLQNIYAHIVTTMVNSESFKLSNATLIVKPSH